MKDRVLGLSVTVFYELRVLTNRSWEFIQALTLKSFGVRKSSGSSKIDD